ncbi:serine/threonine kinase [Fragilaria crotonensis]|nr:serine/threonine kinase [Fragilaria crotonensis]
MEEQGRHLADQFEQDRTNLRHVMNTPSADPVELSLEYIKRCLTDHKLAKGAYGDVFLAEDSRLPKKFAVKMISPEQCDQETIDNMRKSFQMELSTLKRYRHPDIIVLYGYSLSVNSTMQYLVYEYATNGSVADFFTDDGNRARLSSRVRLSIMYRLARAVHFLHTGRCVVGGEGWKVFHRDIKSANVYLVDDLTPRLIDCGLAKFVQDGSPGANPEPLPVSLRSTFGGLAFGTPGYVCPDILRKKGRGQPCPYIEAYDVYSIGVVLVELVLGCLNAMPSTRLRTPSLDVFEMYVQNSGTGQRVVNGRERLMGDADPTIAWNPGALEIVCRAAIQCMDPLPEESLTTKDLLDMLSDAGIQDPQAVRAVNNGPLCRICNNNRTEITCRDAGHTLCTVCILDQLGDDNGGQLLCLINGCPSELRALDLYGRIPVEMYNRFVTRRDV